MPPPVRERTLALFDLARPDLGDWKGGRDDAKADLSHRTGLGSSRRNRLESVWGAIWGATPARVQSLELQRLVGAVYGAPGRTRTYDRQIRRLLLYPLSYGGLRPELCRTRRILRSNILSRSIQKCVFRAILVPG